MDRHQQSVALVLAKRQVMEIVCSSQQSQVVVEFVFPSQQKNLVAPPEFRLCGNSIETPQATMLVSERFVESVPALDAPNLGTERASDQQQGWNRLGLPTWRLVSNPTLPRTIFLASN